MPRKRRVPKLRRESLTPAWRIFLQTGKDYGEHPAHPGVDLWPTTLGVMPGTLELMWQTFRDEILADWIRDHPGSRPWAWWHWDAPEPRRVVHGGELLPPKTKPEDWKWHWRENFGAPKFVESRPPGFLAFPELEGEGVYLRRRALLRAGERPAPKTLAGQEFDPWTEPEDGN